MNQLLINALNIMAEDVHSLAALKGWYDTPETDDQFVARAVNNLHSEASELWEAHREGRLNQPCDKAAKMVELGLPSLTCAEEEFADLIIRTLDDCARLKIDIGKAVSTKHLYNKTRPYRHGGKKA